MRTLVLMRHAKTESFHPHGDHSRELADRGRKQCAAASTQLNALNVDRVLCSSATRTQQTLQHLGIDAEVEVLDSLYNCGADAWLTAIGEVDESTETLLCIGHSPAIPWLATELAHASAPAAAASISDWYPTATWVQFAVDVAWADLAKSSSGVRYVGIHRPLKD